MVCQPLLFDFWFPRYGKLKILHLKSAPPKRVAMGGGKFFFTKI